MTKVVICNREPIEYKALVDACDLPNIELYAPSDEQELIEHIADAEVIFANPIMLSRYINYAKNVKWVQSSFAGIDALNDDSLKKDYILTNMKDAYGEIIAEYLLGYVLMLQKNILGNIENQKTKTWWQRSYPSIVWKKVGIMWIGSIGSVVARYCKSFWMQVYWYASSEREHEYLDRVFTDENQDDFLSDLDYLINILPNTPYTQGIINTDLLSKLPSKAVFMNVGRWANVREDDLIKAIKEKQIAWAVLDVFQTEPLPKESELWDLDNVYITPHVSGYVEDNSKIISTFSDNYKRYISGQQLQNTIDFNKGY